MGESRRTLEEIAETLRADLVAYTDNAHGEPCGKLIRNALHEAADVAQREEREALTVNMRHRVLAGDDQFDLLKWLEHAVS